MAKIRVLQIVTRLAVRGVPRHVLNVAAGLNPQRYCVELLAGRSEPEEGELWEEARERGIEARYLPALQRAVNPRADLAAFRAIYRQLRQGEYDIVHTHISKAGILGRLAARCAGVPVLVHTYHGRIEEVHGGSFRGRLFLACERTAARWTDLLVAVSRETARQCANSGIGATSQYRVIHNGIDLKPFFDFQGNDAAPFESKKGPLIGAIGSLTPEKGLEGLLEAASMLRGRYPQLQVAIVGDGILRPRLQERARQLDIQESVRFTGIVDDVRPWLASFDLLAMPSLSEGFGVTLLEAMAMGCPVVASRVGGIPEVVTDGKHGLLAAPGDANALAEAIDTLLRDEGRRRTMGENGREHVVREFGLEKMLRRLEQEYEELLATTKGQR